METTRRLKLTYSIVEKVSNPSQINELNYTVIKDIPPDIVLLTGLIMEAVPSGNSVELDPQSAKIFKEGGYIQWRKKKELKKNLKHLTYL